MGQMEPMAPMMPELPPEVQAALDQASAAEQAQQQAQDRIAMEMVRQQNLAELLVWSNDFISKSKEWRRKSWEDRWRNYQRDSDGIYDPVIKASKASWQSTAFIPLIPSHRESVQASLYKTQMGSRPVLEMKARGTVPRLDLALPG